MSKELKLVNKETPLYDVMTGKKEDYSPDKVGVRVDKQPSPLEVLKLLKSNLTNCECIRFGKYITIIETALKRANNLEFIAVDIEQDNKALCKENKKLKQVLEIIKNFNCYTVEEIQGQWYLIMGTTFLKSPKMPISKETAMLLKECFK